VLNIHRINQDATYEFQSEIKGTGSQNISSIIQFLIINHPFITHKAAST